MSGEASVMAGVDNEKAVSAALKDPSTEMPPGARRMTEIERAVRIDAIVEALTKQVCYENMYYNIFKTPSIDTNLTFAYSKFSLSPNTQRVIPTLVFLHFLSVLPSLHPAPPHHFLTIICCLARSLTHSHKRIKRPHTQTSTHLQTHTTTHTHTHTHTQTHPGVYISTW